MEDMDIMVILHTDLTMVDMDTGGERRGKPSQPPHMVDMAVDTMDMVDTLHIGHTTDMVDIEGMDTMEKSNLSTVSRSAIDNSPANFIRCLVRLANMLLGLLFCVLGLLGLISFVCIFDNK